MLREVQLPADVPGRLFLYHMPGRIGYGSSFDEDSRLIIAERIDYVLRLSPLDEVKCKSPEYARRIEDNALGWRDKEFAIEDFSVPARDEQDGFLELVRGIAADLRMGKRVLCHCGAGVGRTGTVATCILLALGLDRDRALKCACEAGSRPETEEQRELVAWVDQTLRTKG